MQHTRTIATVLKFLVTGALVSNLVGCSVHLGNSSSPTSSAQKSDKEVLSEVQAKLEAIAPIVQPLDMSLWWVSRDGYSIINDNSPGIEARFPGCVNNNANAPVWNVEATKIVAAVDAVMITQGFQVDTETNSSSSLADTKYYDYIKAYYRGNTKAILSISPDCGSTSPETNPDMYYSTSFGYTTYYQKNYDEQSQFLYDLELKHAIVHVEKSVGDFRVLSINARRTGYAMIVERINGKWTQLWAGQDIISCAVRGKYKIPHVFAPDCG